LVLENVFFEPLETFTIIDEDGSVSVPEEPDIESQTLYRRLMPYAPTYVIADKSNIFSATLPSIN
jgi:hypothetical protein